MKSDIERERKREREREWEGEVEKDRDIQAECGKDEEPHSTDGGQGWSEGNGQQRIGV